MEKLFPEDFFYEVDMKKFNLLSTIRVPKNLLYLTDKLPKPNYSTEDMRKEEEKLKRKTFEGRSSDVMPDNRSNNYSSNPNLNLQAQNSSVGKNSTNTGNSGSKQQQKAQKKSQNKRTIIRD
jgi:NIMA (never in mitosis gene a)-related kinase